MDKTQYPHLKQIAYPEGERERELIKPSNLFPMVHSEIESYETRYCYNSSLSLTIYPLLLQFSQKNPVSHLAFDSITFLAKEGKQKAAA